MRRTLTRALTLAALLAPQAAAAQAVPPPAAPRPAQPMAVAPATDHIDFLFLASTRPVLLRVHVRVDGKPYYAPWDEYTRKLFAHFDRDGNGTLSKAEAERAPQAQYLQNFLRGAIGGGGQTLRMAEVDTNKDGKLSLEEFRAYYRRAGFSPLNVFVNANTQRTDAVNDALFKYLDADKDGKLSQAELAKAPTAFTRLDVDEDEMLTAVELAPPRSNRFGYAAPVVPGSMAMRGQPAAGPGFFEIRPGQPTGPLARQILTKYDKDKDGKLTPAESGLDKAAFDALDANKDGRLDARELAGFFRRAADLELAARVGKLEAQEGIVGKLMRNLGDAWGLKGAKPDRAAVHNPKKRAMPLAGAVRRVDEWGLKFAVGDAGVEVSAGERSPRRLQGYRQFFMQQFRALDPKKRGFVEKKQATQNQFLREVFTAADRDADDKLTEKELTAWLELQDEGAGCTATLSVSDQGRSVFDLFDADRDGRLSVRELRTAWSRLGPLAKSPAGLARADVPRRLVMNVGQVNRGRPVARSPGGPPVMRPGKAAPAPAWFVKMDRNGDGDLSPREFLGTEEDFRLLDADGDGLISAAEARRYEEGLKKGPPKKDEKQPVKKP